MVHRATELFIIYREKKGSREYKSDRRGQYIDDVTIDSWMPSLPRPKVQGSYPHDIIEMSENDRQVGN